MLLLAFSTILFSYLIARNLFLRSFSERLFVQIFTVSTIYYGILGPWYWTEFRSSTFLGVNWGDQLPAVVSMYVLVYLIVITTISIGGYRSKRVNVRELSSDTARVGAATYAFLIVGLVACAYVYSVGGALTERGALVSEDSLLLIFFQLSDVVIGALLFWAATKGVGRAWLLVAFLFVLYAIMAGFRSKLILLLGPMLIYMYFKPRKRQLRARALMVIALVALISLFSIMTITRVKFSGLNLSVLAGADLDLYLYGLFAETNSIFGLASCLKVFGGAVPYAGVSPFIEIFSQLIPRTIYPEKDLYGHLREVAWWIGESKESMASGTTMPFFGEYYAAFGWIGVIALVIGYSLTALYLLRLVRRNAVTTNQYLMGVALVSVFVAYYYFSRGSIAQISKGWLFACGPYFYLIWAYKAKQRASLKARCLSARGLR